VLRLPEQENVRVYLDPATAEVLGHTSYFNVQRFFRSFHMFLFDTLRIGFWVVTSLALVLLVSLATPLLFYRRWWTRFFVLKRGRGPRVFWSDAHKTAGLWTWWFGLIIAVTGMWYMVELFDVDLGYPDITPANRSSAMAARAPLDSLLARLPLRPNRDIQAIFPPEDYNGYTVELYVRSTATLVRERADKIHLDPSTGEILARQRAQELGWPARWVDTADPLHFGNFGGLASQALWFVLGLFLSGLCLSGAWLHAQRLRRETADRSRWPGTGGALVARA
jgi:uncharacterized iron-regulated membrane protein